MDGQSLIDDGRITTFGRLVEAHAVLWHRLDRELQEAMGLSLLWYGVLLHLGRSPGGFRPMGELIGATAFTSGGVTRLVDRMEQSGLVERRPCPGDRRVHYVGLTERGRETLERATEVHLRGIQEHLIDTLSPEEATQLDAILGRLLASAGAATPSPVE
jgi:DNA-binding MarR family transcriptional regulator